MPQDNDVAICVFQLCRTTNVAFSNETDLVPRVLDTLVQRNGKRKSLIVSTVSDSSDSPKSLSSSFPIPLDKASESSEGFLGFL